MKTLLLIDSNALIHRCFHALPGLTSKDGEPAGSLYGLSSVLIKILKENPPDFVAAFFDRPEPTFRKQIFKEYKIHRPKAPDELISQIIEAHRLFVEFGIKTFEAAGYEADDLIGTAVEKFKNTEDLKIIILTGDLDTLQLIENERTVVETFKKGITETFIYTEKRVVERFGILPKQLSDYKGLVGDASDNIKGVTGIGPKTASSLLQKHVSLENILNHAKNHPNEKIYSRINAETESAILSKSLGTIKRDAPIDLIDLENLRYHGFPKNLSSYFEELGFKSLLARINGNKQTKNNLNLSFAAAQEKFENKDFNIFIAFKLIDPGIDNLDPIFLAKKFLKKEFNSAEEALPYLTSYAKEKISEYGLEKVFYEIESPLTDILKEMRDWGIKIDKNELKKIKLDCDDKINQLTKKIYELCAGEFNINSPKQLLKILAEKFNIKTPSTNFEKLSGLQEKNGGNKKLIEFVNLILKYRELFKLKSTYIEPLLKNESDFVHTTFMQLGAATGRITSESPNLQNIPPEIRHVFVPSKGCHLVSLDYSQIELRIMAHLSDDPEMIRAFKNNADIHAITASKVFNLPPEKITPEFRKIAKTLNFGIIYGMGWRSFSKESGLPKNESQKFIGEYFENFSKIREWQEEVLKQAKTFGYVTNLNGRKRWLFDISSFNPRLANEAERAAINMPIQGLAADIIKLAMIKIKNKLLKENLWGNGIKLLLSIHDELVFEIKDEFLEKGEQSEVIANIKNLMESAYSLKVPLKTDVKIEKSWS